MIDLADMFEEMSADLGAAISVFPNSDKGVSERQASDNKQFSGISGISAPHKTRVGVQPKSAPQAGARVRAGVRAKKYLSEVPEMPEMPEKAAQTDTYLSAFPSYFSEKEREIGKPDCAASGILASTIAFDERAAHLEYECGLSRAGAEAQARGEAAGEPEFGLASGGPLLREWFDGLSRLSADIVPCRDYRLDEWSTVLANARDFLDRFGAQAEALGWRSHELFGIHPTHGVIRVDHCGALVLVVGGPVRAITADAIRFDRVTYRRRPHAPVGVLIWDAAR